ncbi:MAG: hypothetical protein RPG89_13445 [Microcystis panniformis WG22]|nr:hypothetical protein [Microcystis panniformis WG22]
MILDFGWIGGVNHEVVCWVLVSGETLPCVEGNWRKYKAPRQF